MCDEKKDNSHKRIVHAPKSMGSTEIKNRVVSVTLEEDEDIEWIWTYLNDGGKYVSGYNTIKKNSVSNQK